MNQHDTRIAWGWIAAGLLLALMGCEMPPQADTPTANDPVPVKPDSSPIPEPKPAIGKISLLTSQAAINLDEKPGADGVQAKAYFFDPVQEASAILEQGRVEFLLYDGRIEPAKLAAAVPLKVWSYSAEELRPALFKSPFGTAYAVTLNWGDNKPKSGVVTISVRLLLPGRPSLYAMPVELSTGLR